MTRREIREAVVKAVYMSDFYPAEEGKAQAETFLDGM